MKIVNPKLVAIPWLSQEVVYFIQNFLTKIEQPKVLEFGSGCSTLFFAAHSLSHLVSVEHDSKWHEFMSNYIEVNNLQVDLRLVLSNYYTECRKFDANYFDLILIDGKDRMSCLQEIRNYDILKSGGVVVLDDSDMRLKYQVSDQIMLGWPKFEISGLKGNPLDNLEPKKMGMATWWVKP